MTDLSLLREPFDRAHIKQREGSGKKMLDYVPAADVIQRLLDASPSFNWTVFKLELVTDNKGSFWLCQGTLNIPGLGDRAGVGTAACMNEDSPKSAETDALKRAAVKFGVALDLHFRNPPPPRQQQQQYAQPPVTDVPPSRNYAQEFKDRAGRVTPPYVGRMSPLCAELLDKPMADLKIGDYAEALKLPGARWTAACAKVSEMEVHATDRMARESESQQQALAIDERTAGRR